MQLALDPVSWRTRRFRLPVAAPMSAQTSDAEPFKSLVALSNDIERREGLSDVVVMGLSLCGFR